MEDLPDSQRETLTLGLCPACGYRGFVLGPRGGHAINIECGNVQCRKRYNVTTFAGHVTVAQSIGSGWDGSRWPSDPDKG